MRTFSLGCALLVSLYASTISAEAAKKVDTMKEVSIIGNDELPNTQFDLPWRLPSIDKRADESPEKNVPGLLRPIEPYRYKEQIHFTKYLEVDSSHFNAR